MPVAHLGTVKLIYYEFDWLIALFVSVVIGERNYFGFLILQHSKLVLFAYEQKLIFIIKAMPEASRS